MSNVKLHTKTRCSQLSNGRQRCFMEKLLNFLLFWFGRCDQRPYQSLSTVMDLRKHFRRSNSSSRISGGPRTLRRWFIQSKVVRCTTQWNDDGPSGQLAFEWLIRLASLRVIYEWITLAKQADEIHNFIWNHSKWKLPFDAKLIWFFSFWIRNKTTLDWLALIFWQISWNLAFERIRFASIVMEIDMSHSSRWKFDLPALEWRQ